MTKEEIFQQIIVEHHKHRAQVKESMRTLDPEALRTLTTAIGIASERSDCLTPEAMDRICQLAHIGAMDILLELEREAEQTAKAV